jgi:hypothetical protein
VIVHLATWVRTLLALALVGNVADWILPSGSIRRQAGLVIGLILLGAMVGPVWSLMSGVRQMSLRYPGSAGSSVQAALVREEAADVTLVLESLPTVEGASVAQQGGGVAVVLEVSGAAPPGLAAAARDTVEEVMSIPGGHVRVTVIRTRTRRPPREPQG